MMLGFVLSQPENAFLAYYHRVGYGGLFAALSIVAVLMHLAVVALGVVSLWNFSLLPALFGLAGVGLGLFMLLALAALRIALRVREAPKVEPDSRAAS